MTKEEIRRELLVMANSRLFGDGPWVMDTREENNAIAKLLVDWGLEIHDPVTNHIQTTQLGRELDVGLWTCFLGHHETCEIPNKLLECGLMSREEVDEFWERFEFDGGHDVELVYPHVVNAFNKYTQTPARSS